MKNDESEKECGSTPFEQTFSAGNVWISTGQVGWCEVLQEKLESCIEILAETELSVEKLDPTCDETDFTLHARLKNRMILLTTRFCQ